MSTRRAPNFRKKTLKHIKKVYNGLTGFGVSTDGLSDHTTVYGEVKEDSIPILFEIFQKYAPLSKIIPPYRNFYDLGSGIGKVVIEFAILNSSLKSTGVEIVPQRIQVANSALEKIKDDSVKKRVEFVCLSMLDNSINYSTACWIFISNLCLTEEVRSQAIEKIGNECKKGSIIICSKAVSHSMFQELDYITLPMSWSETSKVYIYRKIE